VSVGLHRLLVATLRQALIDMDDPRESEGARAWFEDGEVEVEVGFSFADVCDALGLPHAIVGAAAFDPMRRREIVSALNKMLEAHHQRETRLGRAA
jgi:hypothetical protein